MKIKNLVILEVCCLLGIACSSHMKEEHQVNPESHLRYSKSVKLALDEKSTYEFFNFQIRNDTLIVLNQPNSSLDFYNLSSQEFFHRIPIPFEGESGVQKLYGFLYHSSDTIFVFSQFRIDNIKVFDFSRGFRSTISLNRPSLGMNGILNHASLPSMPTYFFGRELFFQVIPAFDVEMVNDSFVNEYVYDIFEGIVLPDTTIIKPRNLHHTPAFTYGVNRLKLSSLETVYSWKYSDSLYYVSTKNDGSKHMIPLFFGTGDLISMTKRETFSETEIQEFKTSSHHYGKILFDIESEVIHRVKYLPLRETKTGNPYLLRDFEIISANIAGEIFGSTVFKGGKYDPRVLFYGPGGIYLPKINPNYDGLTEDFIEYDVFKFAD